MNNSQKEHSREHDQHKNPNFEKKNALEWTVFTIGLLFVVGILSYLAVQIYDHDLTPPDIHVEYIPDPTQHALYRYQLTIINDGGETAENVMIELALVKADSTLEKSEITFQYVPSQSQRIGWIIFNTNPSEADSI